MSAFVLPPALAARATAGSLPHGWLLTGAPEERLEETARALAAAFLCEGLGRSTTETGREPGVGSGPVPCGVCKHCRKVERDVHPDLQWVEKPADKSQLVVDQIRALRADAYVRPNQGARKVYVIDPADAMNPAAQNALLKVLEEGPAYAAFLLSAGQPGRLLDTVRSRCEPLPLPPEEPEPDPAALERAGALAELLMGGDELSAAQSMVALELEKPKADQLAALLLEVENQVSRRLVQNPRRGARVLRALKTCRENGVFRPGAGHTLGWLLTQLF